MTGENQLLGIGDGSLWAFINGAWRDGPEDSLVVPKEILRQHGPAIQGHHYAFWRPKAYANVQARFQFRLTPHSDAGLILRATDPSHFYLVHFPNCGQASRAQHFWAALSRMDHRGYLRIVKLDLVRRVPSTNEPWLDADVHLTGQKLSVRIGDHGVFEASDDSFLGPGRVGVYLFNQAEIREMRIEGTEDPSIPWNDQPHPPRNWFHPCPDTEYGQWQQPGQLVRMPDGQLLLNYAVQERPYRGTLTSLLARSGDNGRTWSNPEPVAHAKTGDWEGWGGLHRFPDGRTRVIELKGNSLNIAESEDDGRRWQRPQSVPLPPAPKGIPQLYCWPQAFLNLSDGSLLLFAYGGHDSSLPDASIFRWGARHCQAFAARSLDNGKTWSDWGPLDGSRDTQGKPAGGNLDMTEVCAAQTGDGRILVLVRPIYSPWMWETWSADGGATWTPALRGPFPGYATPNMLRTSSGVLLVAHRLPGCTLHGSWDEGRTWDQGTLIDSAIWVMGSMIEVEPDLVLYVYWDSFESHMRAQFIRVCSGGLTPGSPSE
ncbi:MAG: exo-alpha-sialidase [Planctomycetes bacterium]|nr:exo-alpha-sialidase [Planctomycetota bacterium]